MKYLKQAHKDKHISSFHLKSEFCEVSDDSTETQNRIHLAKKPCVCAKNLSHSYVLPVQNSINCGHVQPLMPLVFTIDQFIWGDHMF